MNNPLKYTDPDGEFVLFAVGAVIGAYIGGVATNKGELNPFSWDYKSPVTYLGMGFGAIFGGYGGYAIANPGSFAFAGSLGSPWVTGGVSVTSLGMGTDWRYNFHWSTAAGGGGDIELGSDKDIVPVKMPDRPMWNGLYFQGSKEKANELLLSYSKLFNVETSYWSTSKGFYFEPIRGEAYGYTYDQLSKDIIELNKNIGYKSNTIKSTNRYTYVEKLKKNLYLMPNIFQTSLVYSKVHTHPGNSEPSPSDLEFSYYFGIRGGVIGWNNTTYNYGGYGYWK